MKTKHKEVIDIFDQKLIDLAIEQNKDGWDHLFIEGKIINKDQLPINFQAKIDNWVKGYKYAIQKLIKL